MCSCNQFHAHQSIHTDIVYCLWGVRTKRLRAVYLYCKQAGRLHNQSLWYNKKLLLKVKPLFNEPMFVIEFLDRGGEIMLDDCFAEKNSAVCDFFFPTYNQIYTAKWKKMFPSTEPCIRDTTRRSEGKKKTKTIYQLYIYMLMKYLLLLDICVPWNGFFFLFS